MSAEAFRRVRGTLGEDPGLLALSIVTGLLTGVLYVSWMILLVLFVELLLDHGVTSAQGSAAEVARSLLGEAASPQPFVRPNTGMLPLVVQSHGRWYGPLAEAVYRSVPWARSNVRYLVLLTVLAILVGTVRVILFYLQNYANAALIGNAVLRWQRAVFRHALSLGSQAYDREFRSQTAPLLQENLPNVGEGLRRWLDAVVREPAKIAGLVVMVLVLNALLGISFLLLAALAWLLGSGMIERIARRRRELAAAASDELRRLFGLASRIRLIRGYAADDYFQQRYESHLTNYQALTLRRLRYEGRVAPVWQFLGLLVLLSIVVLAGQNILTGRFAVAGAAGVLASLVSLGLPLRALLEANVARQSAARAADAVFDFLDQVPKSPPRSGKKFLNPIQQAIEFDHVVYRNDFEQTVLDRVSLRIAARQRVALVSTTDLEPHTVVYLLSRFIEPTSGVIRFDGTDLGQFTIESIRSQVCTVMQSDLLVPDTVANNIGCGDIGFSLQKIMEAAKVAHAHNFIQKLPHGYECVVGEGGFPLTAGQAYRLALARAILRDPPIVVIEEPTSPLDDETKTMLDDTMNRFLPDRTVIVLPTRMSTLRSCATIFLFDDGKLVGTGSHRELLETSALYRHLDYTRFQSHLFTK